MNQAMVMVALSVALFNASKDEIARRFAYTYGFISVCTLVRPSPVYALPCTYFWPRFTVMPSTNIVSR